MPHWDTAQWVAFTGASVAGLAALALLALGVQAVRSWTADATYRTAPRAVLPDVRPTLALVTAPERLTAAEMADFEQRWRESYDPRRMPVVLGERGGTAVWTHVDPVTEHLAPGPGSITSIRAEEGHYAPRPDPLVDPQTAAEFDTVFARWQRSVDTALAPAMLKAITWAIEGAQSGISGAAALDGWRAGTDTGAFPTLQLATI